MTAEGTAADIEPQPRPWWEGDYAQIDVANPDLTVPGGVVLTARQPQLAVRGPAPFSVSLGDSRRLVLAMTESLTEPIGVVVTGPRAELVVAPANQGLPDIEVNLRVIGRPTIIAGGDGTSHEVPIDLKLQADQPVTVTRLAVESTYVTTTVPMGQISLQGGGYVCRGHHDWSPAPRVEVDGEAVIDIDAEFELVAGSGSRLRVLGRSNVAMLRADGDVEVGLAPSEQPPADSEFNLRCNEGGTVRIVTNTVVRIRDRCEDLEVAGGRVEVLDNARVRNMSLIPCPAAPGLSLRPRATAEGVSGVVRLGECRHARLTGAVDEGLLIESVALDPHQPTKPQWTEAILSGVRVPDGLDGVPVLLAARDAWTFDPDLRELLPRKLTYRKWVPRRGTQAHDDDDGLADASHINLFAAVTAEKSTEGSIRTRAAHAAYRVRQATAASPWERLVLAAYRLFGYAQRPGPPLLLWLLATAAAVPLVQISGTINPSGVVDWFELAAEVVFLPFQFLRLNEGTSPQLADLYNVALVGLRIALTVPFIFAVLAIRQFVRGGSH
jgi:hypothetical protein